MIFISQIGYYFIYAYEQHLIKEEIKEEILASMPESSLELMVEEQYSDKIEWEEDGKEFYLNGEMYDVAKIKHENGKTLLYCVNDKKEKDLLDHLMKTLGRNHGSGKSGRQVLKSQFSVYDVNKIEIEQVSFTIQSENFVFFNVALKSSFKEINSPPPRA